MREIKFRAKVYHKPQKVYLGSGCQDGEWVYGDLHLQSANPHIHIKERHKEPIDVETIGQFTGLYDKNGKEIYEKCELDGKYTVMYVPPKFVGKEISNNNNIDLYDNKHTITKEYCELPQNA